MIWYIMGYLIGGLAIIVGYLVIGVVATLLLSGWGHVTSGDPVEDFLLWLSIIFWPLWTPIALAAFFIVSLWKYAVYPLLVGVVLMFLPLSDLEFALEKWMRRTFVRVGRRKAAVL